MAETRLPRYVQAIEAGGRRYYYFRYKGRRQRLPDDPATSAFHARYAELLAGTELPSTAERIRAGSLRALIRDYFASREFAGLKPRTQVSYRQQLDRLSVIADFPSGAIRRGHILALRDKIGGGRSADLFVQVVRRVYSWAEGRDLVAENPVARVARLHRSERYRAWPAEAFTRLEEALPAGPLKTAYMLGRYTGQRRGDVLAMTRADYDGAGVRVEAQEKTGEALWIPAHPELAAYLDALDVDVGLLAPGPGGRTWDPSGFGKVFRQALDAAGLSDLSFHGLRHAAGAALAEAGCSDKQIASILGHRSQSMTAHYTRQARQRTLASEAMQKLVDRQRRTGTERESGKTSDASGKSSLKK